MSKTLTIPIYCSSEMLWIVYIFWKLSLKIVINTPFECPLTCCVYVYYSLFPIIVAGKEDFAFPRHNWCSCMDYGVRAIATHHAIDKGYWVSGREVPAFDSFILFYKNTTFSLYPSVLYFWKIKLEKSSSTKWTFGLFQTGFLLPV